MNEHASWPQALTSAGIVSVEGVVELEWFGARGCDPARPDLVLEVPHGATRTSDYERVRALLSPDLPADLIDFFYVNTDVGSTEYGRAVARAIASPEESTLALLSSTDRARVAELPPRGVLLARCLVPRTFIDCNRQVEPSVAPGEMTAAINDYIREPRDIATLRDLHRRYHEVVALAYEHGCGHGGLGFMPHTYAPKSVSVDSFDGGIGRALREAYEPERYATWETRPEIDLITEAPPDTLLAPATLVAALRAQLTRADLEVKENASYRLHPATMGHAYSARYPGQILCVEVRRDLLAEPFTPFDEMTIAEHKVARVAAPIAAALLETMLARG